MLKLSFSFAYCLDYKWVNPFVTLKENNYPLVNVSLRENEATNSQCVCIYLCIFIF